MNILLSPIGSFGDVAPMVTYAKYLKKKGHNVTFFSTKDWKTFITESGLNFIGFDCSFRELTKDDSVFMGKPVKAFSHIFNNIRIITESQFDILKSIVNDYDMVLGSGLQFAAFNYAEYLKKIDHTFRK